MISGKLGSEYMGALSNRREVNYFVQLVRLNPFLVSRIFLMGTNGLALLRSLMHTTQIGASLTHGQVFKEDGSLCSSTIKMNVLAYATQ